VDAEAKFFWNLKMKHSFIKLCHLCSGINLIMDFLCLNVVESKLLLTVNSWL
jgi:hypothetical protein